MIAILLAALAQQVPTVELRGRCQYSEAVLRHRQDTVLAECNALTIGEEDGVATFTFRRTSWGPSIRFSGTMTGARMEVTHIALRSDAPIQATGNCEIFRRDDAISVVSCLARAGVRGYAANFMVSRF